MCEATAGGSAQSMLRLTEYNNINFGLTKEAETTKHVVRLKYSETYSNASVVLFGGDHKISERAL